MMLKHDDGTMGKVREMDKGEEPVESLMCVIHASVEKDGKPHVSVEGDCRDCDLDFLSRMVAYRTGYLHGIDGGMKGFRLFRWRLATALSVFRWTGRGAREARSERDDFHIAVVPIAFGDSEDDKKL